jgi:hypothetical protein
MGRAGNLGDCEMKLQVVCTFTESPSFNVRILHDGTTVFYNSERLQGNDRARKAGAILGLANLRIGSVEVEATQEQYNEIADL